MKDTKYTEIRKFILSKSFDLGIKMDDILRYDEEHRYYHNMEHIVDMVSIAKDLNILTDDLFLAIIFHDIIYDPRLNDNEEKSAELFSKYFPKKNAKNKLIKNAILETKTHKYTSELSKQLCDLDLNILHSDFKTFMDFEHKIFKEYQFVDYKTYKTERVKVLKSLGVKSDYIDYVENRHVNIGLYCGSFDPFHIGHKNILEKAEKIFDKVIIARGKNPGKIQGDYKSFPDELKYYQIETYYKLLSDYINNLDYDVTLIRGLRNATDLEYEKTQLQYLKDFKPDINVISIFCDKEFEHISSSAIKQLAKINIHLANKYSLIKYKN